MSRHRRLLAGGALVVVAVVTVLADLLRLDRFPPFAQLVPFRPVLVVATAVVALLVATRRRWWPSAGALACVAVIGAVILVPRSLPGGPAADAAVPGELRVLALNVSRGEADVDAVADLIRRHDADLVALPEAGPRYAGELQRALAGTGYRVESEPDSTANDPDGVSVAVAPELTGARVVAGPRGVFPTLEVVLPDLTFVAFHAAAPTLVKTDAWRADLQRLEQYCAPRRPVIVAGDLNATLDHSVLRRAMDGCADAAAEAGRGLVATWRSDWPRWFGVQIDHVLVGEGLAPTAFTVLDVPGSDHRAVLARIAVAAPAGQR